MQPSPMHKTQNQLLQTLGTIKTRVNIDYYFLCVSALTSQIWKTKLTLKLMHDHTQNLIFNTFAKHLSNREETIMLETIAVILIVLWLLGLVSSYTLGGFIHVLLVVAVITIILRLLRGGKV